MDIAFQLLPMILIPRVVLILNVYFYLRTASKGEGHKMWHFKLAIHDRVLLFTRMANLYRYDKACIFCELYIAIKLCCSAKLGSGMMVDLCSLLSHRKLAVPKKIN